MLGVVAFDHPKLARTFVLWCLGQSQNPSSWSTAATQASAPAFFSVGRPKIPGRGRARPGARLLHGLSSRGRGFQARRARGRSTQTGCPAGGAECFAVGFKSPLSLNRAAASEIWGGELSRGAAQIHQAGPEALRQVAGMRCSMLFQEYMCFSCLVCSPSHCTQSCLQHGNLMRQHYANPAMQLQQKNKKRTNPEAVTKCRLLCFKAL